MKRLLSLATIACLSAFAACGPDDEEPNSSENTPPTGETKLVERDGIPSNNNADRLLYYMSTQEGAEGLHAYRPSTPETPPLLVDGSLSRLGPFHHSVHGGALQADGSVSDFHVAGVVYTSTRLGVVDEDFPSLTPEYLHLATADAAQFQPEPPQVSNHISRSAFLSNYLKLFSFTLSDISTSSLLVRDSEEPVRYEFGMGPADAPLALPLGSPIYSQLGDDVDTHEHWLYLNKDGSLVYYNRDFSSGSTPIDEDTNAPLSALSDRTALFGTLTHADLLLSVIFAEDDGDSDVEGVIYRVSRPTTAEPGGTAKLLLNSNDEPLVAGSSVFGELQSMLGSHDTYLKDDALHIADGPNMFDPVGTTLTRITRDGWEKFDHLKAIGREDADMTERIIYSSLPYVVIPVPGYGTFWAPAYATELIEPTDGDPQAWKRTPIAAPRPESTTITSSANGWVYYQAKDNAVAYHVPTNETLRIPLGTWLGASHNGQSAQSAGELSTLELAEVFLQLHDGRLVALEAGAPKEGMVVLGTLPSTTKNLYLSDGGRGPHRLLRVEHDNKSAEILYVDTRSKGSLKRLMTAPAEEWKYVHSVFQGEEQKTVLPTAFTRAVEGF